MRTANNQHDEKAEHIAPALKAAGWGVVESSRVLRLSVLVAEGVMVYFAVLGALGFRPRDFSKRAVH